MTNVIDQGGARPPVPARHPVVRSAHGDDRIDDYAWLRNRDDPAVTAHLEAENAWTETALAHVGSLRERLYTEMVGRVQETDTGAPVPHGPYVYYERTVEGSQYAVHCRRPSGGGDEQILLDENVVAGEHGYFHLGDAEVSPDHTTSRVQRRLQRGRALHAAPAHPRHRRRSLRCARGCLVLGCMVERLEICVLHASRRRDASVADMAAPGWRTERHRRARPPGGRRTLLRLGRAHAEWCVHPHLAEQSDHQRGASGPLG